MMDHRLGRLRVFLHKFKSLIPTLVRHIYPMDDRPMLDELLLITDKNYVRGRSSGV